MSENVELTEIDRAILRGEAIADAYMELTGKNLADLGPQDVVVDVISDLLLWVDDRTSVPVDVLSEPV